MTYQQNITNLQKTIEGLTNTQKKRLFEDEKKAIIYNNLYVYLYNQYVKKVNIFDAFFKIEAIAHICNNSPRLYNQNLTLAYIQKIYAKTCTDVIKEYNQARKFERENQTESENQNQENDQELKQQIKKIFLIASYIILICYIIILS